MKKLSGWKAATGVRFLGAIQAGCREGAAQGRLWQKDDAARLKNGNGTSPAPD